MAPILTDELYSAQAAARYVHGHPAFRSDGIAPIDEDVLEAIASVAFYASLKEEERERTVFDLAVFPSAESLDADDEGAAPWTLHRLATPQPLDVSVVVRLARATNAGETAIAVVVDERSAPLVVGIVDLGSVHDASLAYGSLRRPARPGVLQVGVRAPGNLTFAAGHVQIAELSDGRLTRELPDIAFEGVVRRRLAGPALERLLDSLHARIDPALEPALEEARDAIVPLWLSAVYRVAIRMRRLGKGGAIIIVRDPPNPDDITLYPLHYDKLGQGIEELAYALVGLHAVAMGIEEDAIRWEARARAAGRQIADAVSFIAHLTRLDGVTLLDGSYNVLGFGGTIRRIADVPTRRVLDATGERMGRYDRRAYGTRHRSVMTYCFRNPGSTGFIVSQDGDMRAVTREQDELYLWDGYSAENLSWKPAVRVRPPAMQDGSS